VLLVNLQITFDLPYAQSLKGRRKLVNSIKEKLKKYNLSILDLSNEYVKEATLAVAFLSIDSKDVAKRVESIEKVLDNYIAEIEYSVDYEVL